MQAWLSLRRLPRRVWVLSLAAFVNRLGTMALPFLTLYLTGALGWPAGRAAGMVALYGAVGLCVAPLAGRLCDRWGAGRLMLWSLALSGLAMLVFPAARGFAPVAAMTVSWALVTEAFRPANLTAITESVPEDQRQQAYALHRVGLNLGMSVGPALGGFLAAVSFRWVWLTDAATSLAAAALLWALLEPAPERAAASSSGPSARALSDGRLLRALAGVLLVSLVFFQLDASVPLHLVRGLGLSTRFYGVLFTVNTALIVTLEIPLNHAVRRWPLRRTLALGALLFAAGFGLYGLCRTPAQVLLATGVWTFGEMILMPAMSSRVAELAPASRRGEYMGLYLMAFAAGFTLAPMAGVGLLERFGAGALYLACAAVGSLAALVFFLAGAPQARARELAGPFGAGEDIPKISSS